MNSRELLFENWKARTFPLHIYVAQLDNVIFRIIRLSPFQNANELRLKHIELTKTKKLQIDLLS